MITSGRYAPKSIVQRGLLAKVVKYNISNFFIRLLFFLGSAYKLHPLTDVRVL